MSKDKRDTSEVSRMLRYDPVAAVQSVYGEIRDPLTLLLTVGHAARKRQMLEELGDTTHGDKLDRYLEIANKEGFREVLKLPFTSSSSQMREYLYVMYHDVDGILLVFDTYREDGVNGGNFYYNIKFRDNNLGFDILSSGGFREVGSELVWSGHHDCREALRHHIAQLRAHGEFIKEWVDTPFLWILHHEDTKNKHYDYAAINAARISMLPIEVQKAIAGKK